MMEEIWKDIKGFEGRYQVSNLGRVRSLNYRHKNITQNLKPIDDHKGYLEVRLDNKHVKIHRLVAMAFVEGYKPGLVVNHLNEIRTDNRPENLQFCERGYNVLYSFEIHGSNKLGRQVKQLDEKGRCLAVFRTAIDAARILKIPYQGFRESLKKNMCYRNGYIFKYTDDLLDFIKESDI
jgi:hypothetical protein